MSLSELLRSPLVWMLATGAGGIWLMLPGSNIRSRGIGYALGAAALGLLLLLLAPLFDPADIAGVGMTRMKHFEALAFWAAAAGSFAAAAGYMVSRNKAAAGIWMVLSVGACAALIFHYKQPAPPVIAAQAFAAACVLLLWPQRTGTHMITGASLGIVSLLLLALAVLPPAGDVAQRVFFWALASVGLISAVATISLRSPVYCALWFALTLLSTAGLLLLQGAQFLGIATVVVYAGAILVTFLFVLMLAQPEGHSYYDRVSWGWAPTVCAVVVAALTTGGLTHGYLQLDPTEKPATVAAADAPPEPAGGVEDERTDEERFAGSVRAPAHMATLGGYLFSRHMLAVEVAGTLLMVALVGAIAIIIQGRDEAAIAPGSAGPPSSDATRQQDAAEGETADV